MKNLSRFLKASGIIVLIIIVLSGCWAPAGNTYKGEYPELYSVAINSILYTRGYASLVGHVRDSRIKVVDEDPYGRVMFAYSEENITNIYSLVVLQKRDIRHAYFYPDHNFISVAMEAEQVVLDYDTSEITTIFTAEKIEELKVKNDWGREINENKCTKVKIVRRKDTKGPVRDSTLNELYNFALGDDSYGSVASSYINYFIKDDYTRSIYVGKGTYSSGRYVVMIFQPDGSYDESKCFIVLTGLDNYQDDLRQLKELNDWNKPVAPADLESSESPRTLPRTF